MQYPKIDTLFVRDENFVVTDKLKKPVIETISLWSVTEKIDGMNIRIILTEDGKVEYRGRSDSAQLPAPLFQHLFTTFTVDKMKVVFEKGPVTLFGEGYGDGIQKGGYYRKGQSFRLFDVLVAEKWWLDWADVEDVASKLEIKTAPYIGLMALDTIVDRVKNGFDSLVAAEENDSMNLAEGIIGKPIQQLFDKRGERVIIKLKTKDFKKEK